MFPSSIAYAYVCRHFQVSCLSNVSAEEAMGTKDILSSIAHFITDRNSKILHTSLSGTVTDIWSRLGEVSELPVSITPVR